MNLTGGVGAEAVIFALFDFDPQRWGKASFLESGDGQMRNERFFFARDANRSEHAIHFLRQQSEGWRSFNSDPCDARPARTWKETDVAKFNGKQVRRAARCKRIRNGRNFF